MQKKIKSILIVGIQTMMIVGITVLSVIPISCKVSETGIHILGGDYSPPVLKSVCVESEIMLKLSFAESVSYVESIVNSKDGEIINTQIEFINDCRDVNIIFDKEMVVGIEYEMFGIVKDNVGNSTTFLIPFVGFNSSVAELMITEVQSDSVSSQTNTEKNNGYYRNEYVEFLVLCDGNLSGIEFISAYDGVKRSYMFPAINVRKGEVLLLHLRNRGNSCVSELTSDLNVSHNSYCVDGIRDLWVQDENTALGNKTDILVLKNSANGNIMDCFMYRESKIQEWTKEMKEFSMMIAETGIYESGDVLNAFITDGLSATKTLNRIDAIDYLKKINQGEEFDYPLKNSLQNWVIGVSSPGTL